MCACTSTRRRRSVWRTPRRSASKSAASACGSQNGWPGASSADSRQAEQKAPVRHSVAWRRSRHRSERSHRVWCTSRDLRAVAVQPARGEDRWDGVERPEVHHVECADRADVRNAGSLKTSSLCGPADSTPPTSRRRPRWSSGRAPPSADLTRRASSIDCPPVPVAWKTMQSVGPEQRGGALHAGRVTPNIVSPIAGSASAGASCGLHHAGDGVRGAGQHPARDAVQPRHVDDRYSIMMSVLPTKARTSPEASVHTSSLGQPTERLKRRREQRGSPEPRRRSRRRRATRGRRRAPAPSSPTALPRCR